MVVPDVSLSVGATPMVELGRLARGLPGRLFAKLEMRNPGGSIKDRVGLALIEDAERRGVLQPGMTLIEPTGGNTGIGLALAAAVRGYRLVLTMPETMSKERVALLRQLGAEVVLTPGILMSDAVERATELVHEHPGALMLDQFRNPANPEVHRRTTAVEIWNETGGAVDVFVSAVGTGGTLTGVGEVLKLRRPGVRVVAVEPAGAAILSGKPAGSHQIPGIGVGFIPAVLNRSIIDEVIAVTDDEAFACARRLAREEGILAGVSSGAALCAALAVASREDSAGKAIVVILADTGERYITTSLFSQAATNAASQAPRVAEDNGVGSAREVTDPGERLGLEATPVTAADVARTCCVVIPIDQMTGRAKMRDEAQSPVAQLAEETTQREAGTASAKQPRVVIVDAFTRVAGEGNRAGVVVDAGGLDVPAMQAMARAVAASETAFLVSDDEARAECRLRYFTPTTEIPFCGHATVAMLHRLSESGGIASPGRRTIVCAAGRFEAEIEAAEDGPRIWLVTPLFPWVDSPLDERVVLDLLGGTSAMRDARLPIQRSGPKLFVPLRHRRDLFALQPHWERLATLGREQGILGVFAFTRDVLEQGSIAHGRYFTPAQGVREDPVTGAANGPLAEYLALHGELALPSGDGIVRARSEQGDAMGKPGRIDLEVMVSSGKIARVRIGGVATTVFIGDLCLERGGASAHGGQTT